MLACMCVHVVYPTVMMIIIININVIIICVFSYFLLNNGNSSNNNTGTSNIYCSRSLAVSPCTAISLAHV